MAGSIFASYSLPITTTLPCWNHPGAPLGSRLAAYCAIAAVVQIEMSEGELVRFTLDASSAPIWPLENETSGTVTASPA